MPTLTEISEVLAPARPGLPNVTGANWKAETAKAIKVPATDAKLDKLQTTADAILAKVTAAPTPVPTPTPTPTPGTLPPIGGPLQTFTGQFGEGSRWHKQDHTTNQLPPGWFFKPSACVVDASGNLVITVDPATKTCGMADELNQFQSPLGTWEIEATLPAMRPGLVSAPLWLYDFGTKDEIDFELVGTHGMVCTVHEPGSGADIWNRTIPGDFSGKHRFAIQYESGKVAVFWIDGVEVARCTPADLPAGRMFPTKQLRAFTQCNPANWAGAWIDPASSIKMVVHGWRHA